MQKKISEFTESYNRFSSEFPELLESDETREELINRVDILSKQLWDIITQRKNESLQERANYMEGGWVAIEMANLTTYIAKLAENEFMRFSAIFAIVTGHVINEELDLQEQVKRLQERGIDSYLESETNKDEVGTSPILHEVAINATQKIEQFLKE